MLANEAQMREQWSKPDFLPGDVVEIIAYPEWRGQVQKIAAVERRIIDGEDAGYWLYSTWPVVGSEGMTTDWKAEHLRLIKSSLPRMGEGVGNDTVLAALDAFNKELTRRKTHGFANCSSEPSPEPEYLAMEKAASVIVLSLPRLSEDEAVKIMAPVVESEDYNGDDSPQGLARACFRALIAKLPNLRKE